MSDLYNDGFYINRDRETRDTARFVLGFIKGLFDINSAVDFGWGVGTWLDVFQCGDTEKQILGLDGEYVNREYLVIDEDCFCPVDLSERCILNRKFDLAISLEVAEHLPYERASGFISDITNASDLVLFSAAFVNQGGDGHINEQPMSFWKSLFDDNDYEQFDIIRPIIHNMQNIPFWYRNNIALYVKRTSDYYNNDSIRSCIRWDVPDIVFDEVLQRCISDAINKNKVSITGLLKNKLMKVKNIKAISGMNR